MFLLGVPILGSVIGIVLLAFVAGSRGPTAANSASVGAFFLGWVVAAVIFGGMSMQMWGTYEETKAKWRAEYIRQKKYRETVERSNAELEEERRIEAEKARIEYEEREAARQKTIAFFEKMQREMALTEEWGNAGKQCKRAFEAAYQRFAFRLAAEEGITDPADVTKVFVQAFPHLPISTDWRLAILRFDAVVDPRIKAVLHHLPEPVDIKDFGEFKRRNSHLFEAEKET